MVKLKLPRYMRLWLMCLYGKETNLCSRFVWRRAILEVLENSGPVAILAVGLCHVTKISKVQNVENEHKVDELVRTSLLYQGLT